MVKRLLNILLKRLSGSSKASSSSGFTLTELLIVVIISGIIISGLLYLVVELLGSDQREASLSETQREMQQAMDYIATELREAVFVYTGQCIQGNAAVGQPEYCPGLANYLPTDVVTNSVPVVAFWKQQPLPTALRNRCTSAGAGVPIIGGRPVPCVTGNSYSLVVYSLSSDNPNNRWRGLNRITRYSLVEFNDAGTARNTGYVNPGSFNNDFASWPIYNNGQNMQATQAGGRPVGTAVPLVDFVDNGAGAAFDVATTPGCPAGYQITPTQAQLPAGIGRGLYACVGTNGVAGAVVPISGQNQDVILYLRGNALGRPGIINVGSDVGLRDGLVPALETRVFARGVLERQAPQ